MIYKDDLKKMTKPVLLEQAENFFDMIENREKTIRDKKAVIADLESEVTASKTQEQHLHRSVAELQGWKMRQHEIDQLNFPTEYKNYKECIHEWSGLGMTATCTECGKSIMERN